MPDVLSAMRCPLSTHPLQHVIPLFVADMPADVFHSRPVHANQPKSIVAKDEVNRRSAAGTSRE